MRSRLIRCHGDSRSRRKKSDFGKREAEKGAKRPIAISGGGKGTLRCRGLHHRKRELREKHHQIEEFGLKPKGGSWRGRGKETCSSKKVIIVEKLTTERRVENPAYGQEQNLP